MIKRNTIEFETSESPIDEFVTKFGGQPTWIEKPQWPISQELRTQMRFLCQIRLTDDVFPGCEGKMAYIFMTDDEEYVDGTWEPDGGENAVIIQPGGKPSVEITNVAAGPTLQNYVEVVGEDRLQPIDVELSVDLTSGEDPEFIAESTRFQKSDEERERYAASLSGNKLGGTPGFLQGDEFPSNEESWLLLMQLDSCGVPFSVNFGDAGIAYAFINENGSVGKFLWQCC